MALPADVKATLKKVRMFAGLSDDELEFIVQRSALKQYAPSQLIFSEGEPCAGLYVVSAGKIRIFKTSANGREQILGMEGPGSSVAELPVFDGGAYPASAASVGESQLLFIARKDFQALVRQHPEVALKLLKIVGARLRRLVGIIEELSFTTVRHRLAAYLLRLTRTEGTKTEDGFAFQLPGTQQELAAHIGTVRELVSRNISRLQAEGILRTEGKGIIITDLAALEELVESPE